MISGKGCPGGDNQKRTKEMSKLRPECQSTSEAKIPDETVLFLVKQAIGQREGLIHGRLDDPNGGHCAMGCFWEDHPKAAVSMNLIDEIAAVNDSMPKASPKMRWKMVNSWLRMKLAKIAQGAKK